MKMKTMKVDLQVSLPNAPLLGAVGLIQTLELPETLQNLVAIIASRQNHVQHYEQNRENS